MEMGLMGADGAVGLGWSDPMYGNNFLKTLSAASNNTIQKQWSFFTSWNPNV
jgi:hypothetical protein